MKPSIVVRVLLAVGLQGPAICPTLGNQPRNVVTVAYLINQYPQTSHSFIRREIAALEAAGVRILRVTVRASNGRLVEPADMEEGSRVRAILGAGPMRIALAVLRTATLRPLAFIKALWMAVRIGYRSERGVPLHLMYLMEACLLREWIREGGATHLHAHFGTNSATVAMLCRELGGPPFSFTCHGPEEFDSPRQLALGEKIKRAAFVVAISEFGRSQLFRWCDLQEWPKIHVVRCTVDNSFLNGQMLDATDSSQMSIPSCPAFLSIGRMVEQKGHPVLIQAAAMLRDQGVEFTLKIIGDGELRPVLEEMIERYHLREQVRLMGWADATSVRKELLEAKALVMASFAEGLPVVIMEALALGRPVISTRVAGVPELVEPGTCGWLVSPGSAAALAEAMRAALLAPPETLRQMGLAGAGRVARWHSSRTEAAKLAELFSPSSGTPGEGWGGGERALLSTEPPP